MMEDDETEPPMSEEEEEEEEEEQQQSAAATSTALALQSAPQTSAVQVPHHYIALIAACTADGCAV